ncbi:hypothetical protein [Caminibacter pacificus]|uniref:Type II secretory pathway pseudopilin PulG n=1 Tax=Caminibacter pacificus TaxID=1424653 RepID=A0AAJ4UXK1_9BACT|nr:hypothetical protein [Caminibacter pacificus]QCI28042.1 hypothetical protein C6V80_03400 [Caminibacter pacificus]ROR39768.1 type II secretory pathway pseudopilin PulG [Caminibacter pacificus]
MKALKPSFTIIELIIVIIIIGIIAYTINFNFFDNNLKVAADQVENHIRYTESLAMKDDKYQPFPKSTSSADTNQSKFWFMQWWQIRFSVNSNNEYFYEIFSDSTKSTTYFDHIGNPVSEFARDPLTHKYLDGNYNTPTANKKLNLTKTYGIKLIKFNGTVISSSTNSKRILFDNFGNLFLSEGNINHVGNEYPLYKNERVLVTNNIKIDLCRDNVCNECIRLNITPSGEVFQSKCN